MARRTKADAQATRNSLLDAAELLFQARGVSRTSLNDIATAAGTSRGAIYWHFKDKAALFNAMMERVTLPLEQTLAGVGERAASLDDPELALRVAMIEALRITSTDAQVRRVFEVATLQVEYNDEMHPVRERHLHVRNEWVARTAQALEAATRRLKQPLPMPLHSAALGLHAIVDGLLHNWLLDTRAFDLVGCGAPVIDAYLRGLGFELSAAPAPHPRAAPPPSADAGAALPGPAGSPTPARSQKRTA